MAARLLLFSVTRKDFVFQTFCTGGKGGQHRNAKQNGVRCIHPPSGARAEHRDGRDQVRNKESAWRKCIETPEFKRWHKAEVARKLGQAMQVEVLVDDHMRPENLRIEYFEPTT
ncbi:MAG TPA: peptide chain release factor-like protein [Candidatus Angelobacter sp.]|nr:peptide chain release factor-like protein [Candidatus Angelobacter sp.]